MARIGISGNDLYSEVAGPALAPGGAPDARRAPVLLLHGGFCSLEHLSDLGAALARDRVVHAYERPGHGRTADIAGDYSTARDAADAAAYLTAQGLGPVHVVGFSDGANIGLLLARDRPELVRSLVAISGNLDPTGFAHADEGAHLPALPQPPSPGIDVEREAYARLSPDGPEHADVVLDKLLRLWTAHPPIPAASLAAIAAPALVMSGDRDSIRPDHSLRIAAAIPNGRLCIVPGATHGLVGERPGFVARTIGEFLDEVDGIAAA